MATSNNDGIQKRSRGRPRKNAEHVSKVETLPTTNETQITQLDENIVLFLDLSDEDNCENSKSSLKNESDNSSEDINNIINTIYSSNEQNTNEQDFQNNILKNASRINNLSKHANKTHSNLIYHCVQLANCDSLEKFVPTKTNIECWWCDEEFDNLPAYIVNYYNQMIDTYYVFGNFCSFNCAAKYNIKNIKDFKCNTRHALIHSLKAKVTHDDSPIKLAPDRELLKSKGGIISIDKFREDFSVITENMRINMPPLIPLKHVIDNNAYY